MPQVSTSTWPPSQLGPLGQDLPAQPQLQDKRALGRLPPPGPGEHLLAPQPKESAPGNT